jgi:hypothetical protein
MTCLSQKTLGNLTGARSHADTSEVRQRLQDSKDLCDRGSLMDW